MPEALCSGSRGTAQHELQLLRSAPPYRAHGAYRAKQCDRSRWAAPELPILCWQPCFPAQRHRETIMFQPIKQFARQRLAQRRSQPPPEEDFGGGDFCSLQEQASTDDDQPLD